ncbi:hypothetical protein ACFCX4_25685 [Kitasatospora sp. NPDC056327]|uniref:hypothetical protein n=1 Tax=Kitasatospora sp. NPDC056327 TaxID=3345785 RepID=UPI0035DEF6E4
MLTFLSADGLHRSGEPAVPPEPHELLFDRARRLLHCTITCRYGFYERPGARGSELLVVDPDRRAPVRTVDLAPEHARTAWPSTRRAGCSG